MPAAHRAIRVPTVIVAVNYARVPKKTEDNEVAMLRMNTRSPQINRLRAQLLEDRKLELLRAAVAAIRRHVFAGLQTICPEDIGGWQMLDDKMIADGIEGAIVHNGGAGLIEARVEFEVEDLKAQRLYGADFISVAGRSRGVKCR